MASAQFIASGEPFSGQVALDLAVVDLTGTDVRDWLQGQVTQDLRTLVPGGSVQACLCKPTGQLLAHLDVWDLGGPLRLLVHRCELAAVLARVEEAVIMEDVEASIVPGTVIHVLGDVAGPPDDSRRMRSRTGLPGFDQILPPGAGGGNRL